MSVVANNPSNHVPPYHQAGLPQPLDPMAHLYNLERHMENAERRTASMIADLVKRLDNLEAAVLALSSGYESVNRQLEQKVVSLALRVDAISDGAKD